MDIREFIANDRFAADAGIRLVSCGGGEAVTEVELTERHLNAVGTAQGGLIFTLADTAFAAVCNDGRPETVALNNNISYLRPATAGTLRATATLVSSGRMTCCADIRVTDGAGRLVAKLQCTGHTRG